MRRLRPVYGEIGRDEIECAVAGQSLAGRKHFCVGHAVRHGPVVVHESETFFRALLVKAFRNARVDSALAVGKFHYRALQIHIAGRHVFCVLVLRLEADPDRNAVFLLRHGGVCDGECLVRVFRDMVAADARGEFALEIIREHRNRSAGEDKLRST